MKSALVRAGLVKKPPVTKKKALPETKMFLNKKVFALAGIDLTPDVRILRQTYVRSRPKMTVRAVVRPRNVAAACGRLAR